MAIEVFPRRPIDRPHTRILTDTSAITGTSSGSSKIVMLIGSAKGGQPNTVYRVRNYVQAKQVFREGELLDALELAWNPSGSVAGAGDILAMRVEDATAATVTKGALEISSMLYGDEANQIQVELATESVAGRDIRELSVSFAPDGYNHVYRNIGLIFDVTYNGEEDYASVEIQNDTLTLKVGSDAETASPVRFNLTGGRYGKANTLANAINSVAGFKASMPIGQDKNVDSTELDNLTETAVGNGVQVTALLADIQRQLRYDDYITIKTNNGSTVEDFELTNLAGGDNGVVPESWYDKIQKFANEGGYYLVPLTDKQAVHAEASAFARDRTNNGDPIRVITGAGHNESVEQLLTRASILRNGRVHMVGFSGSKTLDDGRVLEIPAYMYAAQVAGIASGLAIGESITFKDISINNLATIFEGAELDALNSGGVIMAEFVRNRTNTKFRIVDDVSTYNDRSEPVANQMAVGEANDFLTSELRVYLDDTFIGTRVIGRSPSYIKNSVQSFLDQKKRDQEIQEYDPEDVQVVINGEIAEISLTVYSIRTLKRINVSLTYDQKVLTSQ